MSDPQTIYIGQDEDITSVIDHLTAADSERAVLIVPEEAEIFSSVVNLRLLKREADLQGKSIVLSSSDKMGEYLAEKAQIPFEKIIVPAENKKRFLSPRARKSLPNNKKEQADMPAPEKNVLNEVALPVRRMADIVFPRQNNIGAPKQVLPSEQFSTMSRAEPVELSRGEPIPYNLLEKDSEEETTNFPENQPEGAVDENQVYSQAYEPAAPVEIEDYAGSPNYQQAETGYLAKYLRKSGHANNETQPDFPEAGKQKPRGATDKNLSSHKLKKIIGALVVLGVLTFAFAAYFILPKADLTLTPKRDSSALDLQIIADKNITQNDYLLKKIPAQLIRIEKKETKEFPATGSSSGSAKAKGIITVYNAYSTSSQALVQSTRFAAVDTGKIFRLTKNITIPGAKSENGKLVPSSIDAEVIADQAGADYNIGPVKFNIPGFQGSPKYTGFYGKSSSTMAGGSSGVATIVSAQDLENAKKDLSGQIKSETDKALKDQIPSNFKLFDGALKQDDPIITFSQQAGDSAQKFTATFTINLSALVFDVNNLNDLVDKTAIASAQDKKKPLPETRELDYSNSRINFDSGQISFSVKAQEDFVYKIDTTNLKKSLAGKKEAEIKQLLGQMPEILNAKVLLWPFWVKSIPSQTDKINITVE